MQLQELALIDPCGGGSFGQALDQTVLCGVPQFPGKRGGPLRRKASSSEFGISVDTGVKLSTASWQLLTASLRSSSFIEVGSGVVVHARACKRL